MIVRNEAHVIERCLDSARPAIDALDVCDTGSTDDTVSIVQAWLARTGIPGRVHRHAFVDFGQTRTLAANEARQTVADLGWDPAEAYLLFLDADMTLEVGAGFSKSSLVADAYRVVQFNGTVQYPNVRLVRATVPARFVGATHEYLDLPPGTSVDTLDSLAIDDLNDGGSRDDKYIRDERLLREALECDPGNQRAMFYLAQTYRGLGEAAKALIWYRRRAQAGGWEEEAWYAQFAMGDILADGGNIRAAVRAFAAALRRDRARPEPYCRLAVLLRQRNHYRWATRFAKAGLAIGIPANRSLFVDRVICDWGLMQELAIAAYYTPDREEGCAANERLALGVGAPPEVAQTALNNAIFYAEPLPGAEYSRIQPALSPEYAPCNPSIVRTGDGYAINCRAVSYRIDAYQRYASLEADGILRTRNILMRLDRELRFIDQTDVVCDLEPLRETVVRGLEDCRLVATREGLGFTCTTAEFHPAGPIKISLVMLAGDGRIARHVPLSGYADDQVQKNWLPFVSPDSGALSAVYGYAPFVVLEIDPVSGVCHPVVVHEHQRPFDSFRGSAGPVPLPAHAGGGHLLLVHEVAFSQLRYYLHRFVRTDDEWRITEVSRPFFFLHRGIEFACGMCVSHDGDLLITLGTEDRDAWLCRVPMDTVLGLLRPLPDWPPAADQS